MSAEDKVTDLMDALAASVRAAKEERAAVTASTTPEPDPGRWEIEGPPHDRQLRWVAATGVRSELTLTASDIDEACIQDGDEAIRAWAALVALVPSGPAPAPTQRAPFLCEIRAWLQEHHPAAPRERWLIEDVMEAQAALSGPAPTPTETNAWQPDRNTPFNSTSGDGLVTHPPPAAAVPGGNNTPETTVDEYRRVAFWARMVVNHWSHIAVNDNEPALHAHGLRVQQLADQLEQLPYDPDIPADTPDGDHTPTRPT